MVMWQNGGPRFKMGGFPVASFGTNTISEKGWRQDLKTPKTGLLCSGHGKINKNVMMLVLGSCLSWPQKRNLLFARSFGQVNSCGKGWFSLPKGRA